MQKIVVSYAQIRAFNNFTLTNFSHSIRFFVQYIQANQLCFLNQAIKIMWRNKIEHGRPANLCNQFLIVHLANKIKSLEYRGLGKNAIVYRNAISAIKKYPLPIICRMQLQSLNGIGDYLCEDLQRVIKKHYKAYLKNPQSIQQKKQESNYTQYSAKSLAKSNICSVQDQKKSYFGKTQPEDQDTKTVKSMIVDYKPRINTINAFFLQCLKTLKTQTQSNFIQKEILIEEVKGKINIKGKNWKSVQSSLQLNNYITVTKRQENNQVFYSLTQKGLNFAQNLDAKSKIIGSKNKILQHVKSFKVDLNLNKKQCVEEKIQPMKQNLKYVIGKKLSFNIDNFQLDINKLTLLIDSRQRKNKSQESNYFKEKIIKKYEINCRTQSLPLGDFIWVYEDFVLDFIIERKKADDLASSILDGRYKDQKYRLKNSGIQNIFYMYEGHPSDNCCKTEKQLENALLKTRVKQGFKVIQTIDINESIKFLSQIHSQLIQKLKKGRLMTIGKFQQFVQNNSIQRNLTIQRIFGLGLMSIPGVGKSTANTLIKHFKSYKAIHDYLQKFQDNSQKVQFLKNLFKGTGINSNLPGILVNLLFLKNYKQQIKKQFKF